MAVRVSDSYASGLMLRSMQKALARMLEYQQMGATQRRINGWSDDPRGVSAVQRYDTLLSLNAQYARNLARTRTVVDATDGALQDLLGSIRDVRDIILRETSAAATPASNDQAVGHVQALIEQMVNVLNTTAEGSYIFAGQQTDRPPFLLAGAHVQYQGDAGEIRSRLGPQTQLTVNIPGSELMEPATAMLIGTQEVLPRLTLATRLTDLNRGAGWEPGAITVADGDGCTWRLDLAGAADVAGLAAAVQAQSGGALALAVALDGRGLMLVGTGPLRVEDEGGGRTARSLGLLGTSGPGVLTGGDIRALPDGSTALADLPGLAGALPLGSLAITRGGVATTVDLSAAATLGDVQAAIANAVPGITLEFGDGVLSLRSDGTQTFQVTDTGGSSAATALGLRGTGTPTRLFGVLEDLEVALGAHDQDAARALLDELKAAEDRVLGLTVQVGARENLLDAVESTLRLRDQRLQTDRSREQDADLVEVATELSKAQAAYQASLMAASQMFATNLMDYLR